MWELVAGFPPVALWLLHSIDVINSLLYTNAETDRDSEKSFASTVLKQLFTRLLFTCWIMIQLEMSLWNWMCEALYLHKMASLNMMLELITVWIPFRFFLFYVATLKWYYMLPNFKMFLFPSLRLLIAKTNLLQTTNRKGTCYICIIVILIERSGDIRVWLLHWNRLETMV